MKRLIPALALMWCACVAHEKAADSAAAVGDWKTAYLHYRQAVEKEPERPDLREKFERARREAISDASRRAQACVQQQQWQCAVSEADFALEIEPTDSALLAVRADAGRSLARAKLAEAHDRAVSRDFAGAAQLLEQAAQVSPTPDTRAEVAQARGELARLASAEAEGLRQQRQYPQALDLFALAANLDGARAPRLAAVRQEYDQFLAAEHDRLCAEGDAALAARDWEQAAERYSAASQLRPDGRATPLAQYAGGMANGENALRQKNYPAAEQAFRQAVQSGMDRSGHASERLRAVELRPYAVRIRSVLVAPVQQDGLTPWAGPVEGTFSYLMRGYAGRLNRLQGPGARGALLTLAAQVPPVNQPNLVILAMLPDGALLATPPKQTLYSPYDARFALLTNAFDERTLSFKVVHRSDRGDVDMGLIEVPLGRLVEERAGSFWGGAVAELQLGVEPYEGRQELATVNMQQLRAGAAVAAVQPVPPMGISPARRPHHGGAAVGPQPVAGPSVKIFSVEVRPGDYQVEPNEGPAPELYFELWQQNRMLFRSAVAPESLRASWNLQPGELPVDPRQELTLKLFDKDPDADDLIYTGLLRPGSLAGGRFRARTPRQGTVSLDLDTQAPHGATAVLP